MAESEDWPLLDTELTIEGSTEISDNLLDNNGAIILTDDAQNTVNFIYINPIEFLNNGRSSDIYLNFKTSGGSTTETEDEDGEVLADTSESTGDFEGNVFGNKAAILLTDDAQNTVNFLYINPIEFLNNGRSSDIYVNFDTSGGSSVGTTDETPWVCPGQSDDTDEDTGGTDSFQAFLESIFGTDAGAQALELASSLFDEFVSEDAFSFLDEIDLPDELSFLQDISFPQPLTLLDALGISDEFEFEDSDTSEILDSLTVNLEENTQITDNVIGNNAAILLTDNAQSTVNFLYVNPINLLNAGRSGDIYLDITLDEDDGFYIA